MKSQFHALLREAIVARRTGALSGTAIPDAHLAEATQANSRAFSWLLRRGELVTSEFADQSAVPAALLLLNAPSILKVRWFSMGDASVGDSPPLLPTQQILSLIEVPPTSAQANSNSVAASAPDSNELQRLALGVFQNFFGGDAQLRLDRIVSNLGPKANSTELARACAKTLEPLLGEGMARSYFKKFF
jgi:hypothetical protein